MSDYDRWYDYEKWLRRRRLEEQEREYLARYGVAVEGGGLIVPRIEVNLADSHNLCERLWLHPCKNDAGGIVKWGWEAAEVGVVKWLNSRKVVRDGMEVPEGHYMRTVDGVVDILKFDEGRWLPYCDVKWSPVKTRYHFVNRTQLRGRLIVVCGFGAEPAECSVYDPI